MTQLRQKKVVICDDRADRVKGWARTVSAQLDGLGWIVECITGKDLSDLVRELGAREQAARGETSGSADTESILDKLSDADLVILDSDLSPDPQDVLLLGAEVGAEVSGTLRNQYGDTISRQIRTYTAAGFIVVVNMYWSKHPSARVFDLTMAQGHDAFADLHIQEAELADKSLWVATDPDAETFNPSLRPILTEMPDLVRRSEEAVVDLKQKVLATLGIEELELSPRQLDVFGAVPAEDATFDNLAASPRGLKYPDNIVDPEVRRRVAASVVRRWLARDVLSAQDPISDAAHLLSRFPQLLGDSANAPDVWQAAARKGADPVADMVAAEPARLASLRDHMDRAAYSVDAARAILPALPRSKAPAADLVFAENVSSFVPFKEAKEFEAEVPGTYFRRFLVKINDSDIANEPFNRLLK